MRPSPYPLPKKGKYRLTTMFINSLFDRKLEREKVRKAKNDRHFESLISFVSILPFVLSSLLPSRLLHLRIPLILNNFTRIGLHHRHRDRISQCIITPSKIRKSVVFLRSCHNVFCSSCAYQIIPAVIFER